MKYIFSSLNFIGFFPENQVEWKTAFDHMGTQLSKGAVKYHTAQLLYG